MRFARLVLLTLTTFTTLSTSVTAETINVSGLVEYGPLQFGAPGPFGLLPGASVSLTGDRGFTFNGFVLSSPLISQPSITPAAQCGVGCSPGSTISLNASAINTDIVGHATLDGVSYPAVGPTGPNLQFFFSGQVVAPPFGSSPTAALTVPVDFAGSFNVDPSQHNGLVADALATLQLQQVDCPSGSPFCSGQGWQYEGIRYDLVTPEPTTLLLFGTAMVGLGLHWRRRSS